MSTKLSNASQESTSEKNSLKSPVENPASQEETQTSTVISSSVKNCTNTHYGFEITYPKDWFTTFTDDSKKCLFFAKYSFVVPPDVTDTFVPVTVQVVNPQEWDEIVKQNENPSEMQNIISVENVSLGGKSIKTINATTTGRTTVLKRGLQKVIYLIENEQKPIILTYQQLDDNEDVSSAKKVVEEMVESLTYF